MPKFEQRSAKSKNNESAVARKDPAIVFDFFSCNVSNISPDSTDPRVDRTGREGEFRRRRGIKKM